jgi:FAD/FMN-containing dehydrogenase
MRVARRGRFARHVNATFVNWVGNQRCTPARRLSPSSEAEVQAAVREAAAAGQGVRVVATGHSFSPVHLTGGTLIDLANLGGITHIDAAARRVRARPGAAIGAFGEPLWESGLALANQGDIDTQGISGAVGTATHGSGLRLQSFSASMRGCRLVDGTGEVVVIDESTPDLLAAAQVSIGMLGVMTEVEIEVVPRYRLVQGIEEWTFARLLDEWDDRIARHRHFSCFWCPAPESGALYGLEVDGAALGQDMVWVKTLDEVPDDMPVTPGRVDRGYRLYPLEGLEPNFHELEYFVHIDRAREAAVAMRELMLASQPDAVFPLELRTVAAESAYLSPQFEMPTLVLSVSGQPGTDYWDYLRRVDALLGGEFGARVHWGKLHFLTAEQLRRRYPRAEAFIEIRRRLDPHGVFLNDHLRPLFA